MALFNVSWMLVNLTHLKYTVKHYAKYDITSAQTHFMIFLASFIETRAGQVTKSSLKFSWTTETSFASWVISSRSDFQTQITQKRSGRDQLLCCHHCAHVKHAGLSVKFCCSKVLLLILLTWSHFYSILNTVVGLELFHWHDRINLLTVYKEMCY